MASGERVSNAGQVYCIVVSPCVAVGQGARCDEYCCFVAVLFHHLILFGLVTVGVFVMDKCFVRSVGGFGSDGGSGCLVA